MSQRPVSAYASIIALHAIKAKIRLGVGETERASPQDVMVDVRLYLPELTAAALNDGADYFCYHTLGQKIHALCMAKEYRLIEFLAHEIHHLLRELVPQEVKIWVRLRKPHILLNYVEEGASYTFTDLPVSAWVAPQ